MVFSNPCDLNRKHAFPFDSNHKASKQRALSCEDLAFKWKKINEPQNKLNATTILTNTATEIINKKWVADITYIHTVQDGWCYLASVQDLHTKKIVGYKFGRRMTVDLVLDALENAVQAQKPAPGLILHTDLGTQYTSEEFRKRLEHHGIMPSYSRKGCPYDNACIESFHATLKKEEVYRTRYANFEAARIALFRYIEGWYNRKRIHGSIGYLSPDAFEKICRAAA